MVVSYNVTVNVNNPNGSTRSSREDREANLRPSKHHVMPSRYDKNPKVEIDGRGRQGQTTAKNFPNFVLQPHNVRPADVDIQRNVFTNGDDATHAEWLDKAHPRGQKK